MPAAEGRQPDPRLQDSHRSDATPAKPNHTTTFSEMRRMSSGFEARRKRQRRTTIADWARGYPKEYGLILSRYGLAPDEEPYWREFNDRLMALTDRCRLRGCSRNTFKVGAEKLRAQFSGATENEMSDEARLAAVDELIQIDLDS
jgi:hypothetical protein